MLHGSCMSWVLQWTHCFHMCDNCLCAVACSNVGQGSLNERPGLDDGRESPVTHVNGDDMKQAHFKANKNLARIYCAAISFLDQLCCGVKLADRNAWGRSFSRLITCKSSISRNRPLSTPSQSGQGRGWGGWIRSRGSVLAEAALCPLLAQDDRC